MESVALHCLGGFVVSVCHGLPRPTSDVDVFETVPSGLSGQLVRLAGEGSRLHEKHGVHLQMATIPQLPESYADRLHAIFPGAFTHLRLFALDPYDLALSKLERNQDVDMEDVKYLARTVPLNVEVLRRRYRDELRPLLGRPQREDLTLELWVEAIEEERAAPSETSRSDIESQ
jgi:hypothetical protein